MHVNNNSTSKPHTFPVYCALVLSIMAIGSLIMGWFGNLLVSALLGIFAGSNPSLSRRWVIVGVIVSLVGVGVSFVNAGASWQYPALGIILAPTVYAIFYRLGLRQPVDG